MNVRDNEGWISIFESLVASKGPEFAFATLEKMASPEDALFARKAWEKKVGIIHAQAGATTLRGRAVVDWYAGPASGDRYWPALRAYLERKDWQTDVVDSLDRESTGVMKLLPPPGGHVNAKGLVVGYVQSGKTANYTALIAKAADVGYRLFIVLAGIHNGLRRQTQIRLQTELIDSNPKWNESWYSLTQPTEDFRDPGNTDAFLAKHAMHRILVVVKKNVHVLDRLVKWLARGRQLLRNTCPALIIDDEADQAGLNTGKDDKRSAINAKILALRETLPKSAYVGYTATPFANILIDPKANDLYPDDFIVALPKPAGYFGTEFYFGRGVLDNEDAEPPSPPDLFRLVSDEEVKLLRPASKSDADGFTPGMPPSLEVALRYFLLATAGRWQRGQRKKHSSMLIHTAINPWLHALHAVMVERALKKVREQLRTTALAMELEALWNSEHARVKHTRLSPIPFNEIWGILPEVIEKASVVEDNGQSASRLAYKEEDELTDSDKTVHIAVGGNTLSRGLTLEGLIVSYFVRTSNTYDTLLQMGRWFGYRRGYEDLPRLWMTNDLQCAFHDLATVEEEIRRDIAKYDRDGLTPRQFAVRIRTHPTLAITSPLKMRHAVKSGVIYAGGVRQTTKFDLNSSSLVANWAAGAHLMDSLTESFSMHALPTTENARYRYFTGVPVAHVREFITTYQFHESHRDLDPKLLTRYLDAQLRHGRLSNWVVCVVSRSSPLPRLGTASLGAVFPPVNLINRSKKTDRPAPYGSVDLGTMSTQEDFAIGLSLKERTTWEEGGEKSTRVKGSDPILLLYPISKDSFSAKAEAAGTSESVGASHHVLGVAIACPDLDSDKIDAINVEYVHAALPSLSEYIEEDEVVPEEDDG